MPHKHGKGTHKGYQMPPPGRDLDPHQRHVLRITYGECRVQNPGESRDAKSKCARIAWAAAKRA